SPLSPYTTLFRSLARRRNDFAIDNHAYHLLGCFLRVVNDRAGNGARNQVAVVVVQTVAESFARQFQAKILGGLFHFGTGKSYVDKVGVDGLDGAPHVHAVLGDFGSHMGKDPVGLYVRNLIAAE